jgi:hypothetical protein
MRVNDWPLYITLTCPSCNKEQPLSGKCCACGKEFPSVHLSQHFLDSLMTSEDFFKSIDEVDNIEVKPKEVRTCKAVYTKDVEPLKFDIEDILE